MTSHSLHQNALLCLPWRCPPLHHPPNPLPSSTTVLLKEGSAPGKTWMEMISIGQGAGDQRLRGAQDRLLITRKELLKVSWISFREHILSVFRMLHQRNLAWWKKIWEGAIESSNCFWLMEYYGPMIQRSKTNAISNYFRYSVKNCSNGKNWVKRLRFPWISYAKSTAI